MPIPKDYQKIVETLSIKTSNGQVNWQESQIGVELTINGSKFSIWAGTDEETELAFVSLSLKDESGRHIDNWFVDYGDKDFKLMNDFYLEAKRYASGVSDRLAKIQEIIGNSEYLTGSKPE
jgi:hypothetical protein